MATPTPAAVFDTPEYRRSSGPPFHKAIAAWQLGATGRGVTIGIVDSGIDTTNPEFTGRISSASADVAGTRSIQPEDDHGTNVALVAAAARNDSGVMGIAWQSTILALRADTPGSCASGSGNTGESTCRFSDTAISAGIDRATENGARVINLSLGGSAPNATLQAALQRAAAADVVVVVSAGNDGAAAANPDPFAAGLRAAGNGNVIIAGSVDSNGTISSFSDRAGTEANSYLMALGEDICCIYENGAIKVVTQGNQQLVYVFSGTSFSAPQIAGAAALLRQAFPNLTAAQTVDLLLRTARDAGDPGTDAVYGRGILDIANAFSPQGTTSVAGTSTTLALAGSTGSTSAAMGDAAQAAALSTIVLDSYGRAYRVDLGMSLQSARVAPRLASALVTRTQDLSAGAPGLALAFSVDDRHRIAPIAALRLSQDDASSARVLAARVVAQLTPEMRLGFAYADTGDGLAAALRDNDRPAFLLAGSPLNDAGFTRIGALAFGLRRQLGAWGLTLSAEHEQVRDDATPDYVLRRQGRWNLGSANRFGAQVDRRFGDLNLALGASWLAEDRTILGARFNPALVPGGASSFLLDLDATWQVDDRWQLGAALRRSWTWPGGGGLLADGSHLVAQGWSIDLSRSGLFTPDDRLALRIAQPMRVEGGGFLFDLPTAYSYATLTATNSRERLSLVPQGREIIGELAWHGVLWGGSASASLFYRKDPGHYATLPDEKGVALTWGTKF